VKPSAETLKKLKIDPDAVRYIYRAFDPEEDAAKKKNEDGKPVKKKKAAAQEDEAEETVAVCEACGGVGFVRRTGIFDFLLLNDKIRELIRENPNMNEIRRVAVEGGLRPLFDDGTRLVIEGDTSIQELLRVAK
jgi:type II secretory ATPase GspE/PulE/Tfp pilus assembly ATPase PilB-like protein